MFSREDPTNCSCELSCEFTLFGCGGDPGELPFSSDSIGNPLFLADDLGVVECSSDRDRGGVVSPLAFARVLVGLFPLYKPSVASSSSSLNRSFFCFGFECSCARLSCIALSYSAFSRAAKSFSFCIRASSSCISRKVSVDLLNAASGSSSSSSTGGFFCTFDEAAPAVLFLKSWRFLTGAAV